MDDQTRHPVPSPQEPVPSPAPYPQAPAPYPQAPYPQAQIQPLAEAWAGGVQPVPIAPRTRRTRWMIAGAIVLIVAIVTGAAAFTLSGAAGPKSLTAAMAPKNSIAFMEIRTDLPGDQHAKLADFMSHFPGFKDRSNFDFALDQLLNKITGSVSQTLTYTSAFKPWMEGEVSIAITDFGSILPTSVPSLDPKSLDSAISSGMPSPAEVVIFAIKDRAAAESFVTGQLAGAKIAVTAEEYAGSKVYSSAAAHGAYALTDHDLLIGTIEGVKAALDTGTKGSLADSPNYQAAMKSVSGDSLARFYVDAGSYLTTLLSTYKSVLGAADATLPTTVGLSSADVPAWIAGSVRAESDRMVVDVVMPRVASGAIDNHLSRLAQALPGSSVGVFETHSLGATLTKSLDSIAGASGGLGGIPGVGGTTDTAKSIKDALARFGGIDWIGDGVAVVTKDGSTYGGGLVVEATDAATAKSKVAMINTVTALAGGALNTFSAYVIEGDLDIRTTFNRILDQGTYNTNGNFSKFNFAYQRLQRITDQTSLLMATSGQYASKNLDSAEQFSLGGPSGVRAHPVGEGAGDDAILLTLEMRHILPGVRLAGTPMQLSAFADMGHSKVRHNPLPIDTNNTHNLNGVGVGVNFSKQDDYLLRLDWAFRIGEKSSDDNQSNRIWAQAIKWF